MYVVIERTPSCTDRLLYNSGADLMGNFGSCDNPILMRIYTEMSNVEVLSVIIDF